jgi:hypothetical protein
VSAWDTATFMLVVLPVVALVCLGLLVRQLIDGGVWAWPLWLIILGVSCMAWGYYFTETP